MHGGPVLPPDTHLADGGRPIGGRANGGRMTGTMRVAGAMPPTPRGARLAMPRGAPAPSPGRKERGKLGAGWIMGRGRQQWGMGLANEMNTCIHRWQFLEVLFVGRCLLNLNNVFAKKTAHTVLHILFNAFFCHFCELPGHFSFISPPQEMVKIQKSLLDWMFLTFFWHFSVLSTFFLNTLFCFSHENKRTAKYACIWGMHCGGQALLLVYWMIWEGAMNWEHFSIICHWDISKKRTFTLLFFTMF